MNEYEAAREAWQTARNAWVSADKVLAGHCERCSWHLEALLETESDYRTAELSAAREAVAELRAARDAERAAYNATRAAALVMMRLRDARGGA